MDIPPFCVFLRITTKGVCGLVASRYEMRCWVTIVRGFSLHAPVGLRFEWESFDVMRDKSERHRKEFTNHEVR